MGNEKRKSIAVMKLSTFEMPPAGEVLVLAKRSPIGAQAGKRMLDTVAPEQFELVQLEDELIDAVLVKKHLFLRADRKRLLRAIIEEAKPIMSLQGMVTIKCDIAVTVRREI